MKRAVVLFAALSVCATAARAFDACEHEELSDQALLLAQKISPPSQEMLQAIADLRKYGPTFGEITVAGDWFQNPERVLTLTDDQYGNKLRARQKQKWRRIRAVHTNTRHFQREALCAWRENHKAAIDVARDSPLLALRREALALHYLQDFFSAGHVATPRTHMHDAAAAYLHDHFNRVGLLFRIGNPPELQESLRALDRVDAWKAMAGRDLPFHGDATLDYAYAENEQQKLFVETVSALSIAEVLATDHSERARLEPCFSSRVARDFKELEMYGPVGGIRLGAPSADIVECKGDENLGLYLSREDVELSKPSYELVGLVLRGEVGQGTKSDGLRFTTDLLWLSLADEPGQSLRALLGSSGPSYVRGQNYYAWGLIGSNEYRLADGLSWGIRGGLRRYTHGPGDSWRFDYGVEGIYGIDILTARLAVDRAHSLHSDDRFESDYIFTAGLTVTIPEKGTRYLGPAGRVLSWLMLTK